MGMVALTVLMDRVRWTVVNVAAVAGLSLLMSGCAPPESPARVELRSRLTQDTRLTEDELGRLFDELVRATEGRKIRITDSAGVEMPGPEPQAEVFNVLHNRIGVFDEGLKRDAGTAYRVLNGPGRSDNAEIEATQRLWIEVETLLPRRYEFSYAFQGYGDYAYGVQVEP
jgi:hypothetical protein